MATIPLEDGFTDVLGKAQRGLKFSDELVAARAGLTMVQWTRLKSGEEFDDVVLQRAAAALELGAEALIALAHKSWAPPPVDVAGVKQFNTVWEDMTVNSYLVWDVRTRQAAVFDTGGDCRPILQFARENGLKISLLLLTHTHPDHVLDLPRLKAETGAPAFVGEQEKFADAQPFAEGRTFKLGKLKIGTRLTSGHAAGGITFVITGLERPVAVVGDALFAGSMGGGLISFADALENNRRKIFTLPDRTVLCPGHGPLTTINEEKLHNPFYPEFQQSSTLHTQEKEHTMPERIGVVGVGRMGSNMARRLKDVGYPVTAVYDVRSQAAADLAKEIGAEACRSLARVTELSDVVITVVTDDKAMRQIYGSSKKGDSLLTNAKGRLFINCATLSPAIHVEVEKLCRKAGAESLEACMASSITQAREGTLYLMCGGDESAFHKAKPVLEKLSSSMRYVGKAGQAAVVKALVNMVMNINTAGLAEGLGLGAAYKLDLAMLREVFSQTGANSRVLVTDGEDMQNREHSCFFSAAHAAKDSGIALTLAKTHGLNLPLAASTYKQYSKMIKEGLGELDKSGIAELTFKGRHKGKKRK